MLTKWGKRLLAAWFFPSQERYIIPVRVMTGEDVYISIPGRVTNEANAFPVTSPIRATFVTADIDSNAYLNNSSYIGYCIGSGESPETDTSYKLDNQYLSNSGLSASAVVNNASMTDDTYSVTMLITLTNTSGETRHVAEIGLRSQAKVSPLRPVLLDRTLLDEPFDLPPNGSATIEYTISVDLS